MTDEKRSDAEPKPIVGTDQNPAPPLGCGFDEGDWCNHCALCGTPIVFGGRCWDHRVIHQPLTGQAEKLGYERVEPWQSIFGAVSNHCRHTGPVVEPVGCLDCAQIADEVVGALGPFTTEKGFSPYAGRVDRLDPYPRTAQNYPTHTRLVYHAPWVEIPRANPDASSPAASLGVTQQPSFAGVLPTPTPEGEQK